jgi:thiol-disulfide isomerase/thioredoxin
VTARVTRSWRFAALASVAALSSASCRDDTAHPGPASTPESRAEPKPAPREWYRAVLANDAGEEVPFFVKLAKGEDRAVVDGSAFRATLAWSGPEVVVDFPLAQTRITATEAADGTLAGRWTSQPKGFPATSLAFRATPLPGPDPAQRFAAAARTTAAPAAVEGVWKLDFEQSGRAKLVVSKKGDEVRATLFFITGNTAALRGEVDGGLLRLSDFDAQSPYLMTADLSAGSMKGRWISGPGLNWRETFTGSPSSDFALETEIRAVPRSRLKLAALDAPRYQDKPVLVSLSGSWCPSCAYAAPELVKLYEQHHARGLEIVTLNYEFTDDVEHNQHRTAAYAKEHGFTWDVVPVNGEMEAAMDIIPKELDNVNPSGFPIAIFVNRDRTIEGVLAGFPSPDAAESHAAMAEKYSSMVERILAGGMKDHPRSGRSRPTSVRP